MAACYICGDAIVQPRYWTCREGHRSAHLSCFYLWCDMGFVKRQEAALCVVEKNPHVESNNTHPENAASDGPATQLPRVLRQDAAAID
jgi:hypothetical protein